MIENPFEKNQFRSLEKHYEDLDIYQREDVALIAMNKFKADKKVARQAANHLDGDLIRELTEAFEFCSNEDGIHSIILTSAQRFAFCRGAKIEMLHGASDLQCRFFVEKAQDLILSMQRLQKPIVSANTGLTLGGGFELSLACDYRIASDRSNVTFGFPETSLGIIPAMGGTQNLARLVGKEVAKHIIENAVVDITADQALGKGFVDVVVPAQDLIEKSFSFASDADIKKGVDCASSDHSLCSDSIQEDIVAFLKDVSIDVSLQDSVAPLSRVMIDYIYSRTDSDKYLDALKYEQEVLCYLQKTDDCQEGLLAMMEERDAVFNAK